jgi:type IV pilus assembly protein PilV
MTNSPRSPGVPRQRGVAMIEVLVAVLLFSLGILGLMGLQAQAIKYSVEAEDRNRAALLANEIASAMWLSNSVTIDPEAGTPSWNDRANLVLPKAVVEIDAEATVTNSANVTITWTPPQRSTTEAATSRLTTRVTLPPPPPP